MVPAGSPWIARGTKDCKSVFLAKLASSVPQVSAGKDTSHESPATMRIMNCFLAICSATNVLAH